MAVGVIALIIALFLRQWSARVTALALVFISALSAWPVVHYGKEGYDRVLSMSDVDGSAWLEAHEKRADQLVCAFYVTAAVAFAAMLLPRKFPRAATSLFFATLFLALVSLGAGGYIAYAGGRIRHKEFRFESPPPKPAEE